MSDLSEIGAPESELDLKYAGDNVGLKLFLRSPDDPVVRKAARRIEGRMTRLYARKLVSQSKTSDDTGPDPEAPLSDDTADEEFGEMNYLQRESRALAAVNGWEWGEGADGKPATWRQDQPAFDPAVLKDMIDASRIEIVGQIDAHLNMVAMAQKKPKTPSQKQSG